jgi:thiamine transporter ThiT
VGAVRADNRRKVAVFAALAAVLAASSAPAAADKSGSHVLIVIPLVLMGFALFAAGYYAGIVRGSQ